MWVPRSWAITSRFSFAVRCLSLSFGNKVLTGLVGPPGQVATVAGKKDGMKQGELGGILKELGYTEDQVRETLFFYVKSFGCLILQSLGLQVLEKMLNSISRPAVYREANFV